MESRREENEISQRDTRPAYRGGGVGFPDISQRAPRTVIPGPTRRRISISPNRSWGRIEQIGQSADGDFAGEIVGITTEKASYQPGEYIDIKISFWASNAKGGSLLNPWKLFLIAKGKSLKEEVKAVTVRAGSYSEQAKSSYRLWKMGTTDDEIEFRLYATHTVQGWDWANWPD